MPLGGAFWAFMHKVIHRSCGITRAEKALEYCVEALSGGTISTQFFTTNLRAKWWT